MAKKRKSRQKVERDAVFHDEFRQDLGYWVATNRKVALRLCSSFRPLIQPTDTGSAKPPVDKCPRPAEVHNCAP